MTPLLSIRNEKCGDQEVSPSVVSELVPDQLWVQCENPDCLKWRKVPGNLAAEDLPENVGQAGFVTGRGRWYKLQKFRNSGAMNFKLW